MTATTTKTLGGQSSFFIMPWSKNSWLPYSIYTTYSYSISSVCAYMLSAANFVYTSIAQLCIVYVLLHRYSCSKAIGIARSFTKQWVVSQFVIWRQETFKSHQKTELTHWLYGNTRRRNRMLSMPFFPTQFNI